MVRKTVSQKKDEESTSQKFIEQLPSFCLAALASLLVATLLIPSDAPAQFGTGAPLATLWVMLLLVWLAGGLAKRSSLTIRFGWTSAAVVLLLLLILLSGIVMIAREQGDRAAIRDQMKELRELSGYAKHVDAIVERELAAAAAASEIAQGDLEAEQWQG